MSATLSGSGWGRAVRCPAAYALTSVEDPPSVEAAGGTSVHAWLRAACATTPYRDPDQLLAELPEPLRKVCAQLDLREVPHGETEVACAFDTRTGRVRRLDTSARRYRDRFDPSHEIPGTADLVAETPNGITVVDWKTARWDLDVQEHRPQLEFYGLCAARLHNVRTVHLALGVIDVREPGTPIGWARWSLDWAELARVACEVRRAHARVQASRAARAAHEREHQAPWEPDVRTGRHCRYCPALLACPATRWAFQALDANTESLATGPAPFAAGELLISAKRAEKLIERMRERVGAIVDTQGFVKTADPAWIVRRDARGALRVVRSGDAS